MFARSPLAEDTLEGLAVFADNITQGIERKRVEKALAQSEAQLRQSQRLESIGRWAGGIAHDFNNMLTVINGYSELSLRRLKKDGPLRSNIEEIKKAGERSALLTYQLLAFSRQQVLKPEVVDLNKAIGEISSMLQRLISKDIRLVSKLDSNLGYVKADPGQLSHLVMNLVVNARDAMPQGGTLTIETENFTIDKEVKNFAGRHIPSKPGAYIKLSVGDTGIGMDEATQQLIFEPFYTNKGIGLGTGLGLAMVYDIVKQSGGYIFVDSKVGKGTNFKIYLPRVDEKFESSEEKIFRQIPKGKETILIVDDEDIVRVLTRQILEEGGYKIIEARNGVEALSIFEKPDCKIDLLITDVVMPQMGGRELAEKLTPRYPSTRILFTSGYQDDANTRQEETEFGKNFIEKPFAPDSLGQKVRELLDGANSETVQ